MAKLINQNFDVNSAFNTYQAAGGGMLGTLSTAWEEDNKAKEEAAKIQAERDFLSEENRLNRDATAEENRKNRKHENDMEGTRIKNRLLELKMQHGYTMEEDTNRSDNTQNVDNNRSNNTQIEDDNRSLNTQDVDNNNSANQINAKWLEQQGNGVSAWKVGTVTINGKKVIATMDKFGRIHNNNGYPYKDKIASTFQEVAAVGKGAGTGGKAGKDMYKALNGDSKRFIDENGNIINANVTINRKTNKQIIADSKGNVLDPDNLTPLPDLSDDELARVYNHVSSKINDKHLSLESFLEDSRVGGTFGIQADVGTYDEENIQAFQAGIRTYFNALEYLHGRGTPALKILMSNVDRYNTEGNNHGDITKTQWDTILEGLFGHKGMYSAWRRKSDTSMLSKSKSDELNKPTGKPNGNGISVDEIRQIVNMPLDSVPAADGTANDTPVNVQNLNKGLLN